MILDANALDLKIPAESAGSSLLTLPLQSSAETPNAPALAPSSPPQQPAPSVPGLLTSGNIDLLNRPAVTNADGSVSSVRSMSFNENGKEVLVPTVSEDARIMSNQEAVDQYHKTGKHLGIFDNPVNATSYAEQLHRDQQSLGEQRAVAGQAFPTSGMEPTEIKSNVFSPTYLMPLTQSKEMARGFYESMMSPTAERLGLTPSSDPGIVAGLARGGVLGLTRWYSSMLNLVGADEAKKNVDWFLETNKQLEPSERWARSSYIANVGGNFIGTMVPYVASTVAATLITKNPAIIAAAGRAAAAAMGEAVGAGTVEAGSAAAVAIGRAAFMAKAGANIAKVGAATKIAGWTYSSTFFKDNLDQMRGLQGVSDGQAIGLAAVKTIIDGAIMNVAGVGGMASKALSNQMMGRFMSKPGYLGLAEKILTPRTLGRLTATPFKAFASEFAGKTAQLMLMAEQTKIVNDTMLAIDPANRYWNDTQKWDSWVNDTIKSVGDSAIGGMFGAFIPATMNAMAKGRVELNAARRTQTNPENVAKVNTLPTGELDVKGQAVTDGYREHFIQVLSQGKSVADAAEVRTGVTALFDALYNMANEESVYSNGAIRTRPEFYLKDLNVMMTDDPGVSSRIAAAIKQSSEGGTFDSQGFINKLSNISQELKVSISNLDDAAHVRELRTLRAGVENDINTGAYGKEYVEKDLMPGARKKAKAILGMAIGNRAVREGAAIDDTLMANIFNADPARNQSGLGASTTRRAYSHGGIYGIDIGEQKYDLILARNSVTGKMEGFIYKSGAAPELRPPAVLPREGVLPTAEKVDLAGEINKARQNDERKNRFDEYASENMHERTFAIQSEVPLKVEPVLPKPEQVEMVPRKAEQAALLQVLNERKAALEQQKATADAAAMAKLQEDVKIAEEAFNAAPKPESFPLAPEPSSGQSSKPVEVPQVEYTGKTAVYDPNTKTAIYLKGHNGLDIIHEVMHHAIDNGLLPPSVYGALVDAFGMPLPDGSKRLGPAEQENMANAIAAYLLNGSDGGHGPALSSAFEQLRQLFSSKDENGNVTLIGKMAQIANGEPYMMTEMVNGKEVTVPLKFTEEARQILERLTSAETPDKTMRIYATALDSSMRSGDMASQADGIVSSGMIDSQIRDLSLLNKDKTPIETSKTIRAEAPELFDGDTPVAALSHERQLLVSSYLDTKIFEKRMDQLHAEVKAAPAEPQGATKVNLSRWDVFMDNEKFRVLATSMAQAKVKLEFVLRSYPEGRAKLFRYRSALANDELGAEIVRTEPNQAKPSLKQGTLPLESSGQVKVADMKPDEFLGFVESDKVKQAAVMGLDGEIYSGKTHAHAVMKALIARTVPIEDGAITQDGVFVSRSVAALITGHVNGNSWSSEQAAETIPVDKASKEFKSLARKVLNTEVSAAQFSSGFKAATPESMRASLLRSFLDENKDYADANVKAHEWIKEKYGVDTMHELSDAQLRSSLADRYAKTKVDPKLEAMKNDMAQAIKTETYGTRITPDRPMGRTERMWQWAANKGQRFMTATFDPASLVSAWTNNNKESFLYKNVTVPLRESWSVRKILMESFWQRENDELTKRGLDKSVMEDQSVVKDPSNPNDPGLTMTKNQMLTFWCASNYGKNFKGKTWESLIKTGYGQFTEGQAREAVRLVGLDKNLQGVNLLRQELQTEFFLKASAINKMLTGEDVKPINEPYFTRRYKDGTVNADDFMANLTAPDKLSVTDRNGKRIKIGELNQRALNPDKTGVYLDTGKSFYDHMDAMMNYIAKAQNVSNILRSLDSDVVQKAAIDKWGSAQNISMLSNLVAREMSRGGTLHPTVGAFGKFMDSITGNAYTAFMGFNPNMVPVQSTAMFYNMSAMPVSMYPAYLANITRLLVDVTTSGSLTKTRAYQVAAEHMPYVTGLWRNHFQIKQQAIEAKNNFLGRIKIGGKSLSEIGAIGMTPSAGTDMVFRLAAFKTAFDAKFEEGIKKGLTDPQAELAAKEWASDVVTKANNPAVKGEMGWMQTEGGGLQRSLLAFTSQQFALMKYFVTDIYLPILNTMQTEGSIGQKAGRVAKKLILNPELHRKIFMGGLLPGLALGAIGRRRLQENTEELLQDAFILGLASYIPVVGSALWFGAVLGRGNTSNYGGMWGQLMDSSVKTLADIFQGKASFKTVKSASTAAELFIGAPATPIKYLENIIKNVYLDGQPMNSDTMRKIVGWYPYK